MAAKDATNKTVKVLAGLYQPKAKRQAMIWFNRTHSGVRVEAVGEVISEKKQMLMGLMGDVAGSVGNAFGDAFTAAFSGDKNFFAAFGESLLSSLGNILMQLGGQMIAYGAIIAPLASLLSFTPFGGLGMGAVALPLAWSLARSASRPVPAAR